MNFAKRCACLLLCASTFGVAASPASDVAGNCLADSTNGKDRKELAKWVFLAMAKHPEIKGLSAAGPDADEHANRTIGELFTRLVSQDCATEISAMVRAEGPGSMSKAFEILGRVAMQELMSHPDVNAAFSGLDRYVDEAKIAPVLQQ